MYDDKAKWPDGPWQQEPDKKEWVDRESGLKCLLKRGPHGGWCGYVGVPKSHPGFGMSYNPVPYEDLSDAIIWWRKHVTMHTAYKIEDIRVHGGLTYAGSLDKDKSLHWFGFDCAHAGDYSPAYQDIKALNTPTGWGTLTDYRNMAYAADECTKLAKQLAAITR